MNLDIVVAMRCHDLRINVQDAAGDRILAGEMLKMEDTNWQQWGAAHREAHRLDEYRNQYHGDEDPYGLGEREDVHVQLGQARGSRKFAKTPRVKGKPDSCRIFGSLEGNKVQGDYHITARGHGYQELFVEHLDHTSRFCSMKPGATGELL